MANRESLSLCASCDRCRARKTKCDGQRPCSACKNKYMKKHKLTNVDGVDPARFECFYSPAKRRGPVPGQKQRGDTNGSVVDMGSSNGGGCGGGSGGGGGGGGVSSSSGGGSITPKNKKQQGSNNNNSNNKRRQQQQQQHHQASEAVANVHGGLSINIAEDGSVTSTATGNGLAGNRSLSGNNSQHGGNSQHGNPPQAKPTVCTPANNINTSNNTNRNKNNFAGNNNGFPLLPPLDPSAAAMQQQVLSSLGSIIGMNMFASSNDSRTGGGGGGGSSGILGASSSSASGLSVGPTNSSGGQDTMATAQNAAQQQLAYIQQLQLQQQMQAQKQRRDMNAAALGTMNAVVTARGSGGGTSTSTSAAIVNGGHMMGKGRSNNRQSTPVVLPSKQQRQNQNNGIVNNSNKSSASTTLKKRVIGCENPNVMIYIPLIQPSNAHGTHLRACYTLSFGGLFDLPPIPTDEEYCARFDKSLEPHQLPKFDVAALQAVRFAELAMGALADVNCHGPAMTTKGAMAETATTTVETSRNDLLLALANASVLCLRDCVEEWIHPSLMFDVARTYFFHAIFRAQFNDMEKYCKYRRLCMRHLAQLDEVPGAATLMAAISFQDSLAYMLHNALEDNLPNIDGEIPRVSPPHDVNGTQTTNAEKKYGIRILPSRVASNPINQIWMQGAPTVLINEAAPAKSRVLDAMACAIRSSLDEAKSRQTKEPIQSSRGRIISRKRKFLSDAEAKDKSATEWEVEHHPELSFINLLAEAFNLLKKDEDASSPALPSIFGGHRLLVSALDVILNLDRVADNFQLQRIFNVLEGMIERPIMLFQGGPTYHIFTNCTIFLAHIINKLHSDGFNGNFGKAQFDDAINVYNGSRIVLTKHQSKLPRRLRCHEVPSPNICAKIGEPMIDLTNASLCLCRSCQDCIAPGLSAKEVAKRVYINVDKTNWQRYDEKEFELNDHALLTVLSRIIAEEEMIL